MRQTICFSGVVVLVALLLCTVDPSDVVNALATETHVDRRYYRDGRIMVEESRDRHGELHGLMVEYDREGRVSVEQVWDHGQSTIHRQFDYDARLVRISERKFVALVQHEEPMDQRYLDYRCEDRDPSKLHVPND